MNTLLEIAAGNAIAAALLAGLVLALSPFVRRPAVRHALWLIVLARLLMPPVWRIEVPSRWDDEGPPAVAARPQPAPEPIAPSVYLSEATGVPAPDGVDDFAADVVDAPAPGVPADEP